VWGDKKKRREGTYFCSIHYGGEGRPVGAPLSAIDREGVRKLRSGSKDQLMAGKTQEVGFGIRGRGGGGMRRKKKKMRATFKGKGRAFVS